MNQTSAHEEIYFIDCLTCNQIKEEPEFHGSSICTECGDQLIISK